MQSVDPIAAIEAKVRSLRTRSRAQAAVKASVLGAYAGTGTLLVMSAASGAVVTPGFALFAWLFIAAATAAGVWLGLAPLRTLAGGGITRVLGRASAALPSQVRSAIELREPAPNASDSLRRAHLVAVASALRAVPVEQVLPWRAVRSRQFIGAGALFAVAMGALFLAPPLRHGATSLLRPASTQADGSLRAPIVSALRVRLIFPSYLRRPSQTLTDPSEIRAPRGTTVELHATPVIDAQQARALVGERELRLRTQGEELTGRLVMRSSGPLKLRVYDGQRWYEDDAVRTLVALPDDRPEVELTSPKSGTWVQADAAQMLQFRARDDAGITEVDAVVRLPGGGEVRQRIWSARRAAGPSVQLDERASLLPAAVGVRAGDRFELWLEARDGDVVTGPNVGRSESIVLEAASEAQHLSRHIPALRAILDDALDTLADRLEFPVPADAAQATERFEGLRRKTDRIADALDALVAALLEQAEGDNGGLDADDLGGARDRLQNLLRNEARLHRPRVAGQAQRSKLDRRHVVELENDALLFEDMLSMAHVQEAAALTEELDRLRTRIGELIAQLEESDSPAAREALVAEIARAERRLRDLMRSLSQMAKRVPTEFVNQEAMQQGDQSGASLADLRAAVESGDLDAAAKQLEALQAQLGRLSEGLQEGGLRMQQQRRGPRNQAMDAAQEQLAMMADEQGRLAQRSGDRLHDAFDRARGQGQAPAGLSQAADGLQRQVQGMETEGVGMMRRQTLDQAAQRAHDTADLLRSGDLSEARSMAGATARSLQQLSDSLEMEARMYPEGSGARQRAQRAKQAAEAAAALEQRIDRQMPQRSDMMTPQQQSEMRADARSQRALRDRAADLREQMQQGPDGVPLSPDAARSLREAERHMAEASQRLQQGDARRAAGAQQEATEQLQDVAEQLRKKQQGQGMGGQSRGQPRQTGDGEGEGRSGDDEPVAIPDSEDFQAPQAMRRRLLDAMREPSPAGFERAVDRYYRELLR